MFLYKPRESLLILMSYNSVFSDRLKLKNVIGTEIINKMFKP